MLTEAAFYLAFIFFFSLPLKQKSEIKHYKNKNNQKKGAFKKDKDEQKKRILELMLFLIFSKNCIFVFFYTLEVK